MHTTSKVAILLKLCHNLNMARETAAQLNALIDEFSYMIIVTPMLNRSA